VEGGVWFEVGCVVVQGGRIVSVRSLVALASASA
jgi:pyrimidine deaminase RibD-like protein